MNIIKKSLSIIVLFFLCTTAFAQKTADYQYDNLNRLISVTYGNGTSITYQYDELGNRTTKIVNSQNEPPTISDIADLETDINTATLPIGFTISDTETPAENLTLAGSSSDKTLVLDANITFSGSGTDRTVTITPAADQYGTTTITITVTDESQGIASDTFLLTVVSTDNECQTATWLNVNTHPLSSDLKTVSFELSTNIEIQVEEIHWVFGDGKEETLVGDIHQTYHHIYADYGQYECSVTVTDSNGDCFEHAFIIAINESVSTGEITVISDSFIDFGSIIAAPSADMPVMNFLVRYKNGDPVVINSPIIEGTKADVFSAVITGDTPVLSNQGDYALFEVIPKFTGAYGIMEATVVINNNSMNQPVIEIPVRVEFIDPANPDIQNPKVSITYPTTGNLIETNLSYIILAGTAEDNDGVTEISWTDNNGGSGNIAPAGQWESDYIYLKERYNIIVVTAKDSYGNIGTDSLIVLSHAGLTNLDVSDISFEFSGYKTTGFYPLSRDTFNISNNGTEAAEWQLSMDVSWLSVSRESGILNPGESIEITLSASEAAKDLPEGTHPATIFINETDSGTFEINGTLKVFDEFDINWARFIDPDDANSFIKMIEPASNGGFTIVGSLYNERGGTWNQIYLTKLNHEGIPKRRYTLGQGMVTCARKVSDGNILIVAKERDSDTPNATIMKVAESGVPLWRVDFEGVVLKSGGSVTYQKIYALNAVDQLSGGEIVAVGSLLESGKKAAPWIVRLDADGHVLSQDIQQYHSNAWFHDVCHTSDGGFITTASLEYSQLRDSYLYMGILKFDQDGNIEWEKKSGNGKYGLTDKHLITEDSTGSGYLVLSATCSNKYTSDPYFKATKLKNDGSCEWIKELGYSHKNDTVHRIRRTSKGHFLATGSVSETSTRYAWFTLIPSNGYIAFSRTVRSKSSADTYFYDAIKINSTYFAAGSRKHGLYRENEEGFVIKFDFTSQWPPNYYLSLYNNKMIGESKASFCNDGAGMPYNESLAPTNAPVIYTLSPSFHDDGYIGYEYSDLLIFKADFKADPIKGYAPLTVNFTDSSPGNIQRRYWDFGDGYKTVHKSAVNQTHDYQTPGVYTVSLEVTSPNIEYTSIDEIQITVLERNTEPSISGVPKKTIEENAAYYFRPDAYDLDEGDTLTFSIENIPDWAGFDTSTGILNGTPGNEDVGTSPDIVITVTDNKGASVSLPPFDLTVIKTINHEPSITNITFDTDVADKNVMITWTDNDLEENAAISLFYDENNEGRDGTPIQNAQNISEDDETDSFEWDTSGLPEGNYFIYAVIDDSVNEPVVKYSQVTLTVTHNSTINPDFSITKYIIYVSEIKHIVRSHCENVRHEVTITNHGDSATVTLNDQMGPVSDAGGALAGLMYIECSLDSNSEPYPEFYATACANNFYTDNDPGENHDHSVTLTNFPTNAIVNINYIYQADTRGMTQATSNFTNTARLIAEDESILGEDNVIITLSNSSYMGIRIFEPDGNNDIADQDYTITWTDGDPDSNADIYLYYDTDNQGQDGIQINTEPIKEDDGSNAYQWNTSQIPEGDYYIYAVIDDGVNEPFTDYSEGTIKVEHNNKNPIAAFSTWADPDKSLSVNTDATHSFDPDGTVVDYNWSVSDGQTGSGSINAFSFNIPGAYTITLEVTDDSGSTSATQHTIHMAENNKSPIALFNVRSVGLKAYVNGTSSFDPDGSITDYAWATSDNQQSSANSTNFTFAASGTHIITLTITDDKGATATTQHAITVAEGNNSPGPVLSISGSVNTPMERSLSANLSSDPDGTITDYSWFISDGQTASGLTGSLVFDSGGTYIVTLVLTDDTGATTIAQQKVIVEEPDELPAISNIRVTNVRGTQFTVSWTSTKQETGQIRYGTSTDNHENWLTANDDRDANTTDDIHHVTIDGLSPTTTYYYEIISGTTTDNNKGTYHIRNTGPVIVRSGSCQPAGRIFKDENKTQPAYDSIVYITILGDQNSATESVLVTPETNGYWFTDIVNFRIKNNSGFYSFTCGESRILIEASGGKDGNAQMEIQADNGETDDMILKPTHIITTNSGEGGSIKPPGNTNVTGGADQTFTIEPDGYYEIADVKVDGVSKGAINTYTFPYVSANHEIEATFVKKSYTISAVAGNGGSIDPSGNVTVECGTDKNFTITPAHCYLTYNVKLDGSTQGQLPSYTFQNVTQNHTIEAEFQIRKYTISASAGIGGRIDPPGDFKVNCGSPRSFAILPDMDFDIYDVTVDDKSVGAVYEYGFPDIASDHTIHAVFGGKININTGWNMAGLPLAPDSQYSAASLAQAIKSSGGNVTKVQRWDGSAWKTYDVGAPYGDFNIKMCEGYFLLADSFGTWLNSGEEWAGCTYEFSEGWNLFTFPAEGPFTAKNLAHIINNCGGSVTKVMQWDGSGWQSYSAGAPFGNFEIRKNESYFLYSADPVTIGSQCIKN